MKSNYSGKHEGVALEWVKGALVPTDTKYTPKIIPKKLGKYAQCALDALKSVWKDNWVHLDTWHEEYEAEYQKRFGKAPDRETWRSAKTQLHKRGLVEIIKADNRVVLLDE